MVCRAAHLGGAALLFLVLWAAPAAAVDVEGGCEGSVTSLDADGETLDQVSAPGEGGTKSDPLLVDADGTIAYEGSTPGVFHDHTWKVAAMGITVKDGGSANADDESSTSDTAEVGDYLPFDAPGLYKISGSITATEGECSVSAWVKIAGSPVGSPPFIAGAVSAVGGLGLLAWAWPR